MMDGVRMRLLVIVWNMTVDAAMAVPTSTMPSTLRPRNGMTKLHDPFASLVMRMPMAMSASASMMSRLTPGENRPQRRLTWPVPRRRPSRTVSADTGGPPEQQHEEQGSADEADHRADRNFVRVTDYASEDVADEHESCPEHRQERNGAPDVVAQHHADHVRNDEADERNRADVHDVDGRYEGHDREAEGHDTAVIDSEVFRERLTHAGDREPVRRNVGEYGQSA